MAFVQGHKTPLGHKQQLCEILSKSNITVVSYWPTRVLAMCALWPWPRIYGLGSAHDTPFGWGQQSCEILCRSNLTVRSYHTDKDSTYLVCANSDLELWDITLGQGHDTLRIVWNIVQIQPNSTRSYGWDKDFSYVCTLTLTCEMWPWVKVMTKLKVMTHPRVVDNSCVKYYPYMPKG